MRKPKARGETGETGETDETDETDERASSALAIGGTLAPSTPPEERGAELLGGPVGTPEFTAARAFDDVILDGERELAAPGADVELSHASQLKLALPGAEGGFGSGSAAALAPGKGPRGPG